MNKFDKFPILKIENVNKSYFSGHKEVVIFRDLNISFFKNSTYAITGVSGSGKTTFLNLISGFDNIDSGKIIFNEKVEMNKIDEFELAKIRNNYFGYVFQSFYLLPELNVIENIMLPALKKGIKKKEAIVKANKLIKDLGIEDIKFNKVNDISGGEAQRVALARALINDPEIILADEPTGNLDVKNRKIVIDLLFELVKRMEKLLIIVTHDLNIASTCDYKFRIENFNFVEI